MKNTFDEGCIVRITQQARNVRRTGLTTGMEVAIVEPPENHTNSPLAVYVNDVHGRRVRVDMGYFGITNKTETVTRSRKVTRKRTRR